MLITRPQIACFPLQLMPETLFLACALIDRYLAVVQVARKNLQLVRAAFLHTWRLLVAYVVQISCYSVSIRGVLTACSMHVCILNMV